MPLDLSSHVIEYDRLPSSAMNSGSGPCVVFCSGYNSNRQGNKARALESFCRTKGLEYIRFDYAGHGDSGGDFADSTISTWLNDTLQVIDQLATDKEVMLVGSSMGGWLALLAALARPERVTGLLLIACAADMTRYYPARLSGLSRNIDDKGRAYYEVPNEYDDGQPYHVYQAMIDSGESHFLLHQPINLTIPVHLIHGVQDDVIEWQRSQKVMEQLASTDVTLTLIKDGDHRLSKAGDLLLIEQSLNGLIKSAL